MPLFKDQKNAEVIRDIVRDIVDKSRTILSDPEHFYWRPWINSNRVAEPERLGILMGKAYIPKSAFYTQRRGAWHMAVYRVDIGRAKAYLDGELRTINSGATGLGEGEYLDAIAFLGRQTDFSDEEKMAISRAMTREIKNWPEAVSYALASYEAAIGNVSDGARAEFRSFLERAKGIYPNSPSMGLLVVQGHLYSASQLRPENIAEYFSGKLLLR